MKLLFDTETTGVAQFNLPPNHPSQPRMVQLGMILVDDKNEIVHECGIIIKPDGYVIPEEVSKIHGITHEYAMKYGISITLALAAFDEFQMLCNTFVGHNLKFDKLIVEGELSRLGFSLNKNVKEYCTMLSSTSVCKLPNPKRGGYKWPKLSEAYKYFFNEELVDAHDALTDVRATLRIYKHLTQPEVFKSNQTIPIVCH